MLIEVRSNSCWRWQYDNGDRVVSAAGGAAFNRARASFRKGVGEPDGQGISLHGVRERPSVAVEHSGGARERDRAAQLEQAEDQEAEEGRREGVRRTALSTALDFLYGNRGFTIFAADLPALLNHFQ